MSDLAGEAHIAPLAFGKHHKETTRCLSITANGNMSIQVVVDVQRSTLAGQEAY